jgi:hypothetical protein
MVFTNKTDRHDITEILLKVAFNIITLSLNPFLRCSFIHNNDILIIQITVLLHCNVFALYRFDMDG